MPTFVELHGVDGLRLRINPEFVVQLNEARGSSEAKRLTTVLLANEQPGRGLIVEGSVDEVAAKLTGRRPPGRRPPVALPRR
jgi:hypothetical protein